jgi:hypothetical protein
MIICELHPYALDPSPRMTCTVMLMPGEPGYLAAHADAEARIARGERQWYCELCGGLWRWTGECDHIGLWFWGMDSLAQGARPRDAGGKP